MSKVHPLAWFNGCFDFDENSVIVKSPCVPCSNNTYKESFPNVKFMKYECRENVSIFVFESDIFENFVSLEKLDVSSIGIEKMQFKEESIEFMRLKEINITNFSAANNSLNKIPKEILSYMPDLMEVNFTSNVIKFINKDDFNSNRELRKLNLMKNQIYNIETGAFSMLYNLEILDLSNNELNTLKDNDLLKNNINLRLFNVGGNPLKRFSFRILPSSAEFDEVYLPLGIQILDMSCATPEKCHSPTIIGNAQNLENLQNINASGNSFEDMMKLLEKLNINLKLLDLSRNHIGKLNDSVLERLSELQHLNLSHSNIFNITAKAFINQPYLLSLDLHYNNLTEMNFMIVSKTLSFLNLEGNKLTRLDIITPLMFPKLDWLAINKNRFNCIDLRNFFRQWIKMEKLQLVNNCTTKDVNIDGVDCDPDKKVERSSGEFQITSTMYYVIITIVIISILIIIAVAIVSVACRRQNSKSIEKAEHTNVDTPISYQVTTTERFNRVNRFNQIPYSKESDYEEINVDQSNIGHDYSVPTDVISTEQRPQSSHLYTLPYGYQLYSTVKKP